MSMMVAADPKMAWITVDEAVCRINARHQLIIDHFQLSPGQHWCIFGGNGAGKSLFAALLCGRLRSGGNRVSYAACLEPGRDIAVVSFEEQQRLQARDNRHDISEYNPSARDAGTTVRRLISRRPKTGSDAFDWLIGELGLTSLLDQGIRFLSSGQMRRAMLAAALYRRPKVLVLDEPLESIDRQSRERIIAVIQGWQSGDNASLVLNRRQSSLLPGMNRLMLMQDLRIVASGLFSDLEPCLDSVLPALPALPERLPEPVRGHMPPPLPADTPLIELRGISAAYGALSVLANLDWTVFKGQHVLIEGPNGCGKSTLLALLTGDNHKAYGQDVFLFGRRRGTGESVWNVKSLFGIVSNELHNRYVRGWNVLDVVVSGFFDSVGLYDDAGASEIAAAREWLSATGLQGVDHASYHELSFGQQRLVLLARAMVKHPRLLVLDEPCVGLDDRYRARMLELMDRIAGGGRTQLLYVSHTTGEAPACINQWFRFISRGDSSFRVRITP
ncbi:MAG: ATP-binding cassette domain-containing protein [Pseudohongiellaceae bacterium]